MFGRLRSWIKWRIYRRYFREEVLDGKAAAVARTIKMVREHAAEVALTAANELMVGQGNAERIRDAVLRGRWEQ